MKEKPRVLVVRADRIGDVILSTPVFDALKARLPGCSVSVLVKPLLAPLMKLQPSVDEVLTYEPDGKHRGFSGFRFLVSEIRSRGFDAALILQSQFVPALAVRLAGIPLRVGPLSKLYSYLFYSPGIRQHRSQSIKNEADYNLELASRLWDGNAPGRTEFPARLKETPELRSESISRLRAVGWRDSDSFVVVHPGMGGSALNWPWVHYVELIQRLIASGTRVWLSFGASDRDLRAQFEKAFPIASRGGRLVFGEEFAEMDSVAGIFSLARAVIAPSTGPLHVAAAMGRPVISFYPPIRVQSATRWGPYVKSPDSVKILTPAVECGEHYRCAGKACPHFFCMERLTVTQALDEVRKHL